MPHPGEVPTSGPTPRWAVQRALQELYDVSDPELVSRRAAEIAQEARELEDERHDEYDDPDRGGEG